MSDKVIRLIDRSRIVQDWKCPRSRFLGYELDGRGVTKSVTSLELYMGITVHDALAAIALFTKEGKAVDIDAIAQAAYHQMFDNIMDGADLIPEAQAVEFAQEQATLTEGMIRGYFKHVWPILMNDYAGIVAVEAEMEYKLADDLIFMAKPDLILEDKEGDFVYIEYKTTSSKKESWTNSWNTAVQLHSSIMATEQTLGTRPTSVRIVGLYKGYECLAPDTPVLTADLNWVPVGTLKVGDKIAGFDEEPNKSSGNTQKRQWKEAEVLYTGRQNLPSYKLTLEDDTEVVCSENHLWLTCRDNAGTGSAKWTKTRDLTKGCHLIRLAETWEHDTTYDAGYLAAAFDGEGNISQHQTPKGYWLSHLAFTQKDNEMLGTVKNYLATRGFTFSENNKRGDQKIGGIYIHRQAQLLKFLGSIRPKRLLPKFSFNKLGGTTVLGSPLKIKKLEFIGNQEVVTLGTSTETLVANGLATHNSYGKQSSPFCYAYKRAGNPPFTEEQISYDYKAGFKRFPVWELPGGVRAWVDKMPADVLAAQFPMTAPIFVDERLVEGFFKQTLARERTIQAGGDLDVVYPQRFDQCVPYFGKPCQFRPICHGGVDNPLEDGFTYREPHHEAELKALGLDHDEQ